MRYIDPRYLVHGRKEPCPYCARPMVPQGIYDDNLERFDCPVCDREEKPDNATDQNPA